MALDDLKGMDEKQLEAVISEATALLEERKSTRRQEAIEAARTALAAAGLTFRDVATDSVLKGMKRVRKAATEAVEQGRRYVNSETGKEWIAGRGRRPNWVAEQMASGQQGDEEAAGRKE